MRVPNSQPLRCELRLLLRSGRISDRACLGQIWLEYFWIPGCDFSDGNEGTKTKQSKPYLVALC
jgi:hypothetical protein